MLITIRTIIIIIIKMNIITVIVLLIVLLLIIMIIVVSNNKTNLVVCHGHYLGHQRKRNSCRGAGADQVVDADLPGVGQVVSAVASRVLVGVPKGGDRWWRGQGQANYHK